ncbi:MAG TPA: hypothetical protein VFV07_05845 [Rhizomicrobium sp.]|nr:hypothetical protein [Rhizomicrobium sp.]
MSDISTPAQASSARMLKAVVIGLGALIVIALAFVALGIVKKFSGDGPSTAPSAAVFSLPAGAKIVEMQSEPNRLILRVRAASGADEVDIIDTEDGRLVARIK